MSVKMWSSVLYHQARTEKPIAIVVVVTLILTFYVVDIIFNQAEEDSFSVAMDESIEEATTEQDNLVAKFQTLPQSTFSAIGHFQRSVERQLVSFSDSERSNIYGFIVGRYRAGLRNAADFLHSFPGAFLFDQPFSFLPVSHLVDDENKYKDIIMDAIDCNLEFIKDKGPSSYKDFYDHGPLRDFCGNGKWKSASVCTQIGFLNAICTFYPFRFISTSRLPLYSLKDIMNGTSSKLVYLIRDPRAILYSRRGRDACDSESCDNSAKLCQELLHDFEDFTMLKKAYPDRVKLIRIEDKENNLSESLADNLELPKRQNHAFKSNTDNYHPRQLARQNTEEEHLEGINRWRKALQFDQVEIIQQHCRDVLNLFGYKLAKDEFDLFKLDPVEPLPHMLRNYESLS